MSKGIMMSDAKILDESQKGFPHRESNLAEQLGVSRGTLRDLRGTLLTEDHDWKTLKKRTCLSDAAVRKLDDHLNPLKNGAPAFVQDAQPPPLPAPASADAASASAATPGPIPEGLVEAKNGTEVFLVVYRANFRNHRLIEAHLPGADPLEQANIQRVRVGSSANFIKGMVIPCRHLEADYWELARPCPRWRGRW